MNLMANIKVLFEMAFKRPPKLLILINLVQDLDILLPLAVAFKGISDVKLEVLVIESFGKQSPRIERLLRQAGIQPKLVRQSVVMAGRKPLLNGVKALITASESNHAAHRTAYELALRANKAHVCTYTFQHGFENIGLTYSDDETPIDLIHFASQKIFIWGGLETLHDGVLAATREKCIPVGCPKYVASPDKSFPFTHTRSKLIAIFENLHWSRYSDSYRASFISGLYQISHQFPNITFLVKPHHAGQWLTGKKDSKLPRHQGELPKADNLVIADPTDPQWEGYTAPALLNLADAAITTPSTVALDAARLGCPVAVVGDDLELSKYHPLTVLKEVDDWLDWVSKLETVQGYSELKQLSEIFVKNQIVAGDVISRIVAEVVKQFRR